MTKPRGPHDSPTTTANHPDWRSVTTKCQYCESVITEWRPKSLDALPVESHGRRRECYRCLANWWHKQRQWLLTRPT